MKNITAFLPKAYIGMMKMEFGTTYATYQKPLLCYCSCKVSSKALAEDLTQETFLRAWRYLLSGKSIDNMRAFLYKILHNLIIDEYRKVGVHNDSLEHLLEEGFEPGIDDNEQLVDKMEGAKILTLLKDIKKPYRDILSMKYIKGFSIEEISDVSRISKNTVAVRVCRGLQMLRINFFLKFNEQPLSWKQNQRAY